MTRAALATHLVGIALAGPVRADTDEAWLQRAAVPPDVRPLLAVILDRSAATARVIAADEDYDAARDYGAGLPPALRCDPTKAFFRRGPGPAPDCAAQAGLDLVPRGAATGQHCDAARNSLSTAGAFVASRAAQWRPSTEGGYWASPSPESAGALECRADRGRHGESPGAWYASDGTGTQWSPLAARQIAWDRPPFADAVILYAGNFLNYLRAARAPVMRTIAEHQSRRLAAALAATADLDVAIVRVDDDGPDGGYVARAPVPSASAADEIAALEGSPPAGPAPLGETLAETAFWLSGLSRRFGTDDRADPAASVPDAPTNYRSPFVQACAPVTVAYVTAGETSDDEQAAAAAGTLPHFDDETGGCVVDCAAMLGGWLGTTDLRSDLPGTQSAPLTWIAPASDSLTYVNLVAAAFQRDAAVAAGPQISAAGFVGSGDGGREPGVVLGLMAPRVHARWHGNLFRYALQSPSGPLEPPRIVDRDGSAATDAATGLPLPATRSLWSDAPDADLLAGGAAGRLPAADARRLYSDVAGARLLDAANRLDPGNARIGRAALGLDPAGPETVDDLLAQLAADRLLGDPGLDAPIVVDDAASGRQVVLSAGQDGLLQAFDADSGSELWGWMPKNLLPRLPELLRDSTATSRSHGIDGKLVLHEIDTNGDGRIDAAAGEHRWLLFGLGRGGARYYALDLARTDEPRLLWSFDLEDAGVLALADPVVTRFSIAGSGQSAGDWVVLLSGGYDPRFDSSGATGRGAGAGLFLLDAESGRQLWSAGGAGSDLPVADLASVPSAPRALDLDGDAYLDRAYVLDVTGSLWRVDFTKSLPARDAAGARRIARLGAGEQRYFATPDASIVRSGAASRLAIAAGSGWITRPRDTAVTDRMTVVFDPIVGATGRELAERDLFDATGGVGAMPPDAAGWFLRLEAHGPGEKVAGPAISFDRALRFETYQPLALQDSAPCGPPRGASRMYAIDLRTALPRNTAVESEEDEPDEIAASGIPAAIRFGFPGRWDDPCEGCRPRPFGIAGAETFDPGYAGDPVRTSWRKLAPPPVSP
jgi:type IV pilus assembly protein PilY1